MSDEGSGSVAEFTFVCPECEESMVVDSQMRDVLVEQGCVVCESLVTGAAFTPGSVEDPGRDGA